MLAWFKSWRRRQTRMRSALKGSHLHKVFGDRVFHSHLWSMDKRSLAGGLSLGLFVAFTPTIPFQMLMCTFAALFFRVNLPIALAACWVTNPITAFPTFLAARNLGRLIFDKAPILNAFLDPFRLEGGGKGFIEQSIYLWTGTLVFSSTAAVVGNVFIRIVANLVINSRKARIRVRMQKKQRLENSKRQ